MNARAIAGIIGLVAVVIVSGCESVHFKGGVADKPVAPVDPKQWPFVPVAMRIHPFTSFDRDARQNVAVLDARIELLDRVGDMTKGVGRFRFELYRTTGLASTNPVEDKLLYAWQVPMTTIEQNRQHYDAITRTYSFQLKMDHPIPPDVALRLTVQFDNAYGRRLSVFRDLPAHSPDADTPKRDADRP